MHIYVLETQTDSGRIPEKRNRHCLRLGRHWELGVGISLTIHPLVLAKGASTLLAVVVASPCVCITLSVLLRPI